MSIRSLRGRKGYHLWNHLSDIVHLFSYLPHLISCSCFSFSHLLHSCLNLCGRFVDLFLLIFYGDLDSGRLSTDLFQKSFCCIKLGI